MSGFATLDRLQRVDSAISTTAISDREYGRYQSALRGQRNLATAETARSSDRRSANFRPPVRGPRRARSSWRGGPAA